MLCLVDYASLYWRHWHATKDPGQAYELTIDRAGFYVDEFPRAVVCCEGGSLKRKEIFPEYKANRTKQPQEALDAQRAVIEQIESWWVPVIRVPGHEADDVIATLCAQSTEEVRIVSSDKDLYQILSDTVTMETSRGIIGPAECVAKFGVTPEQMRDWLALVGDSSDNVPGCPSCGPGRARDLLARFGTIDGIRAADDKDLLSVRGVGAKTVAALREWDPTNALALIALVDSLDLDLGAIAPEEDAA